MKNLDTIILEDKSKKFWEGKFESDGAAEVSFTYKSGSWVAIEITDNWYWAEEDLLALIKALHLIAADLG